MTPIRVSRGVGVRERRRCRTRLSRGAAHYAGAPSHLALLVVCLFLWAPGTARAGVAPAFEASFPALRDATDSGATLDVRLDAAGRAHYAVLPSADAAPSAADVAAQSVSGALDAGTFDVPTPGQTASHVITGLAPATAYKVHVVADDSGDPATLQASVTSESLFTAQDVTPPSFGAGHPVAVDVTDHSFKIESSLNEDGTVFVGVLARDATAPDSQAVIDGTGFLFASSVVAAKDVVVRQTFDGLSADDEFDVYVVAVDDHFNQNVQTTPTLVPVTVLSDQTPPTFAAGYPALSDTTDSSVNVRASITEVGSFAAVVVIRDDVSPTSSQVVAGADSFDQPAFAAGTQALPTVGQHAVLTLSGLAPSTDYDVYVVAADAASNWQEAPALLALTTSQDATPPSFTSGFPREGAMADTSGAIEVSLTEASTVYVAMVAVGTAAPSVTQVVAGTGFLQSVTRSVDPNTITAIALSTGMVASTSYDVYVVAEDKEPTPNRQASAVKTTVTTGADATPPAFSGGRPVVGSITDSSIVVTVSLNEAGTYWLVVVASGASAPSAAAVRQGQGATGGAAPFSATGPVPTPGAAVTTTIVGLAHQTAYDVYVVGGDSMDPPNVMATPTKRSFSTLPDATAPTFSVEPAVVATTDTSITVEVIITEAGTVYAALRAQGSLAPTSAQVVAGGAAFLASDSVVLANAGDAGFPVFNGLQHSTTYDAYFVAADAEDEPNVMASPLKVSVTSGADATPPNYGFGYPAVGNIADTSVRISVTLTEAGSFHYVVLLRGAPAPGASAVVLGRAADGQAGVASGSATVPGTGIIGPAEVSGLVAETDYDAYILARDVANNVMSAVAVRTFSTGPDATPPEFSDGYPSQADITDSTATFSVALNEGGYVYAAAVARGAEEPTPSEVRIGADFVAVASVAVPSPATSYDITLALLHHNTEYDVYLVATDDHVTRNMQAAVTKLQIRTELDSTPPVFLVGTPAVSSITDEKADVTFRLNEAGSVFYVILEAGRPVPNVVQTMAGKDGNDVAGKAKGSKGVSAADDPVVGKISGLFHSTAYILYAVAQDAFDVPNTQTAPTAVSFSTGADATGPKFVLGFPRMAGVTDESGTLEMQLNEVATVYYIISLEGGAPPPAQDIIDDNISGEHFVTWGRFEVSAPTTTASSHVTGLTASRDHHFYLICVDVFGNKQALVTQVDFRTAPDATPPVFMPTYPLLSNLVDSSALLNVKLNEPGRVFYAIVVAGSPAPTSQEVLTGFYSNSATFAARGNRVIVDASEVVTAQLRGLAYEQDYVMYVVAQDAQSIPNVQAAPVAVTFRTLADTTPPELIYGYPIASPQSDFIVDVGVKMNEPGEFFIVVVPENSGTEPTAGEVMSGVGPRGTVAVSVASGVVTNKDQVVTVTMTGFEPVTDYDGYIAVRDAANPPNVQPVVGTMFFTTLKDTTPPTIPEHEPFTSLRDSSVDLSFMLNERGYVYWALRNASADAMTKAEVESAALEAEAALADEGDRRLAVANVDAILAAGRTLVPVPFLAEDVPVTGLEYYSDYRVTYFAEDDAEPTPNVQSELTSFSFRTRKDMTPPDMWAGFPAFQDVTYQSATLVVRLNEPGVVHWVAIRPQVTGDIPPPTPQQVLDGWTDSPHAHFAHGNISVPTARVNAFAFLEGMRHNRWYNVYFIAQDGMSPPNVQTAATMKAILTADLPVCLNREHDASEADVDCGGGCSAACAVGKKCRLNVDCVERVCGADKRCAAPHCFDNVRNGGEVTVDDCALDQCKPFVDTEALGWETAEGQFDVTGLNAESLEADDKKRCGLRVAIAESLGVGTEHVQLQTPFTSPVRAGSSGSHTDVTTITFIVAVEPPQTVEGMQQLIREAIASGTLQEWIKRNGVGAEALDDYLAMLAGQQNNNALDRPETSNLGNVLLFCFLALLLLLCCGCAWMYTHREKKVREVEPRRSADFVGVFLTADIAAEPDEEESESDAEPVLPSDSDESSAPVLRVHVDSSDDDVDMSALMHNGEVAARRIIERKETAHRLKPARGHRDPGSDDSEGDDAADADLDLNAMAAGVGEVMADAGLVSQADAARADAERRAAADAERRRLRERATSATTLARGLPRLRTGASLASWASSHTMSSVAADSTPRASGSRRE
uniref:Uncharacterized protein n=1 Tax=Bicosoecida sp. CB-2014 TaxID=1486930 RepID=A0A7S1CIK6_9STRA|mmetsp:Transcript_28074/g.97153  ORF Transcript_28074/g.97153 Transcript_28074/m.97153 type:complete len:2143 (+) Transcript_28074:299-6727(+)|eukprot:CAMPEP_0203811246 /NCGR_PEP_ID=MMETSP0115-20131106/3449_1 /ASSEMBLY_ACC=CAM_ASM_000227 /TAXON_ID=33651 /ORGANISM="Bicosoecid sp, Strain ms1" /LENGTH=2142 /DNA_ID=CAMNT_0050720065 /DNA_START=263 /DNA_END=6691 /DNA_ORIENTATION=-